MDHSEFSARGGKARAKRLTVAQRSEIARRGGLARQEKRRQDVAKASKKR